MSRKDCVFCDVKRESHREFLHEGEYFLSFYDKFPVNEGHSLVIPRTHVETMADFQTRWSESFVSAIKSVQSKLQQRFSPAGFNIGLNEGSSAGQTIDHIHWHIIPRYQGDVDNPEGGVRGVIPEQQTYGN